MDTRVAEAGDLDRIGETLARAFEHDPLWGWAFEDASRERKLAALERVFGFFAGAALGMGWVRVTDGVEAVALWIPPGSPEMPPAEEERLPGVIAAACEPEAAARVKELLDAFERNHPHEPPHFYLSLLATHPDHAGRGLGVGLVAANLAEIDAGDPPAPAFLESSNPRNVPRYECLGFRPIREVELVPGRSGTQMWRGPRGSVPPAMRGRFDPGP
ncbi:MAG: GNAT family N-acetyltransferase [Actinobacteria bacterium]|nr:GNAT family N-acetyltransferase [Actinomycetota bacterium]